MNAPRRAKQPHIAPTPTSCRTRKNGKSFFCRACQCFVRLETSEVVTRFLKKTRPVACSEHLGAVERFLGSAAKCSRAGTGAEKHVGGSLRASQLKMARSGALRFWWAPARISSFKASQFQLLPGTSFCQLIVRINRKLVQVVRSVGAKRTQQVEQS